MINRLYKFLNPKYQPLFLEYKVDLKPRYEPGKSFHSKLYAIIDANREEYKDILRKALHHRAIFWQIMDAKHEPDQNNPTWNNGFLPGLDVIGIYTFLTEFKPRKYVEIGSGNSTKIAYKAKMDNGLQTEIISIDPNPRAEIENIADKIIREPFENIDTTFLEDLQENDILFVDNSHRILPNSDAMVFFLEVLPQLKKGVIVHLHDIYLPYDYPQEMCNRFYNEQYGLAMYLLANPGRFKILLPNFFIYNDEELSEVISPVWEHSSVRNVERHGGSFWFKINE